MRIYSELFKSNSPFIKDFHTYESFWSEVCTHKISNSKYQVVECNSPTDLIKYFAIIASGRVAVMIDPTIPQSLKEELLAPFNIDDTSKESFKEQSIQKNETSTIIFTSGSSGRPKAVELTHHNFFSSATQTNTHYQISNKDCWAMTLPFFHIGGLMIIYRTLMAKAQTVFCNPKDIGVALDKNREITILSLVDLQLQKLLVDSHTSNLLKNLRGVVLGGAKTSLNTLRKSSSLGIKLSNSYGQTETCSQICATPFSTDLKTIASVGTPLGNTSISFTKNKLIQITGDTIARGIFNEKEFHGQILTSDTGEIDSQNNLIIYGRADDIYISGGKNISPHTVDNQIKEALPHITSSKTVSVSDQRLGQVGVTFIETSEVLSLRESLDKIKEHLPKYHEPKLLIQTKSFDSIKSGIKVPKKELETIATTLYKGCEILGNPLIRGNLSKEILLIFHGFMGTSHDFEFLIPELEEHFLLIFVNLPGHDKGGTRSYSNFADYILELSTVITNLNKLRPVNVIGYSLGGRVASLLAMNSKNIKTLILESSGLGISESEKETRAKRDKILFEGIVTNEDLSTFLRFWYQQAIFNGIEKSPRFEKLIHKNVESIDGWKYSLEIMGQAKMPAVDIQAVLENTERLYYLFGVNDEKYKLVADQFTEIMPIENASHNTHDTNRNSYLKAIKSILLK